MQHIPPKIKFTKLFTQNSKIINFVKQDVKIFDNDGRIIFENYVEAPESWSINAINIFANKYLRKRGVPKHTIKVAEENIPAWLQRSIPAKNTEFTTETSVKQVIHRIVGAWAYWGWKGQYFPTENDAEIFFNELQYAMLNQMCFPNSPQFFNTGVHWAYGIEGTATDQQYYVDPHTEEICKSISGYERPQPHACFILSAEDKLIGEHGILDTWNREGILFKFGSGSGFNASKWREKGATISVGGVSSGVINFLSVGDVSAGAIKSGGTTRRAAKMIVLDIDHPEVIDFIEWKTKEEYKMMCLVAGSRNIRYHCHAIHEAFKKTNSIENNPYLAFRIQMALNDGILQNTINKLLDRLKNKLPINDCLLFDSDWRGAAYGSISGQNANNSILISDEFMHALINKEEFNLIGRVTQAPVKTIPAQDLWDIIIENAYLTADPGVQYRATINSWNTCDEEEIVATNPCAEYIFLNDTACNLCSFKLTSFLEDNKFNPVSFCYLVELFTLALEISIYMAQFPSKAIAKRSYEYRTLGLGFADLGGLLLTLGLPYDSDQGRALARDISALLTGQAYKTSALIAASHTPFARFKFNKESMMRVIRNHARYAGALDTPYEKLNIEPLKNSSNTYLSSHVKSLWQDVLQAGEQYGFRNAQTTAIAPTGTIGICMDCDTTGCEPYFSLLTYKQLLEGNIMVLTTSAVPMALRNLDYTLQQIKEIIQYIEGTKTLAVNTPINLETLSKFCSDQALIQIQKNIHQSLSLKQAILSNLFDKVEDLEKRKLHLLFTYDEIQETEDIVYGRGTIEGAPYLKSDHLPIFDCANKSGKYSHRYIHWEAHLKMLSAMSPIISGGLSKTVNLPNTASRTDVSKCYFEAWKLGIKACALYVDGCKSSQPLNLNLGIKNNNAFASLRFVLEEIAFTLVSQGNTDVTLIKKSLLKNISFKASKRSLPMKRKGYSQKVYIGQDMEKFIFRTGEYEDGSVGEIFITPGQGNSSYKELLNCISMLISLALQYEIPLEEIGRLLYTFHFAPYGKVSGHDTINNATSIVSLVIEDLIRSYSKTNAGQEILESLEALEKENQEIVSNMICVDCKHTKLQRSGRCFTCINCGSTTGCS